MSPRWNWDFEDEKQAARAPGGTPPTTPPLTHRARFRRRRLLGGVALTLLLVLVVAALAQSRHQSSPARATRPADAPRAAATAAGPPFTQADQSEAVSAVLAYTPFVKEGGTHGHDVALTFDDGPGPYTPGVLSVLERYHAVATFFSIGVMERYFSASTVRELRDGDAVGDHTETHPEMARLSAHDQREELFEQIARVELLGGPRPRLFRPPYGSFNATTMRELHSLRLLMVLWSVDTDDYLQPGVPVIVERALAGARPGAIILMHDAGGVRSQTIAALGMIIEGLRARGLQIVTVPQLLRDDPPPPGQPLPPNLSGD